MSADRNSQWILPVLKDVRVFLVRNGLEKAARAVQDAMSVVKEEIELKKQGSAEPLPTDRKGPSTPSRCPKMHLVRGSDD